MLSECQAFSVSTKPGFISPSPPAAIILSSWNEHQVRFINNVNRLDFSGAELPLILEGEKKFHSW